jgi:hypothetical protein
LRAASFAAGFKSLGRLVPEIFAENRFANFVFGRSRFSANNYCCVRLLTLKIQCTYVELHAASFAAGFKALGALVLEIFPENRGALFAAQLAKVGGGFPRFGGLRGLGSL